MVEGLSRHVGSDFHSARPRFAAKPKMSRVTLVQGFTPMALGTAGAMCLAKIALKENIKSFKPAIVSAILDLIQG